MVGTKELVIVFLVLFGRFKILRMNYIHMKERNEFVSMLIYMG